MAEAALSFAVDTLGNLLIEKVAFLLEVKDDVEWVRDELKRMRCFLSDSAKRQSHNDIDTIQNRISDIRKVAHDAEDAIEMFVLHVESKGLKEMFTCLPSYMYYLTRVGEEIERIRKKLKEIEDGQVRYRIADLGDDRGVVTRSQLEVETRRRLSYWQNDKQVVGLDKDVKQLLGNAVFERSEGLSVAAILGMGGIGKSTLARKIYNHPEVTGGFECKAWVVVSSEFNPEDILKQILKHLGFDPDPLLLEDRLRRQEALKREVHEHLTGKRYFVVLDDVWEARHWESLRSAFPDEDKGSRVLLTSRNQVISSDSGYVHNMKPLDADESWDLFMKKVFVDNAICPEELRNTGEEILKKCGGLPLAISVVGGILAKRARSKREWEKVVKEMKYHLGRRSMELHSISAILELSYQNLSPELKACFLCLGFFKEDDIIIAENLIHIWVALGLVEQEAVSEEEKKEDVAQHYLNELISRNMVQVKEMDYDKVMACQMHDLLRDLSIRKAKEEIGFEVLRDEWSSNQYSLTKPRHRAMYCSREPSFGSLTNRNHYLRSLFIHGIGDTYYNGVGPSSNWKSFELLKVLHLENAWLHVFPKAIGELTGLRCLTVHSVYKDTPFASSKVKLPRSWAKLKNLEVLDLWAECKVIIIDKVILKMHSLRHLLLTEFRSKVDLRKMGKLETLRCLQVEDSDLRQLQGMTHISELWLDVSYVLDGSLLFEYLGRLDNLVTLGLVRSDTFDSRYESEHSFHIPEYKLRLPENFLHKLSYLTLFDLPLAGDLLQLVEKLPNLLDLKLRTSDGGDHVEETMVMSGPSGFPKLKVLHLDDMRGLRNMEIGEGAMPELNQLIISGCPNLNVENLPEHLKSAVTYATD